MEEEDLQENANWILAPVIILTTIGILMVFSTSFITLPEEKRNVYYLALKQLGWASIGFLSIFLILKKNLKWWNKYSIVFFLLFLLFLLLTLFIPSKNGARRWICGFQPSEFVRVFYILYLSKFFSKDEDVGFKTIIPPCIVLGIIIAILAFQPHRGMATFFCILTLFVFILSGLKKRHIFILSFALLLIIGRIILSKGYSIERINKWYKGKDIWQIKQAEIALGAGGLMGVGLGGSMQKLFCVPISHSDFIFAIFGEENGLLGIIFLFFLFALFAFIGFFIALNSSSRFGFLLAFSLTLSIVLQAIINIAIVSNTIPTTGLPLPFISYGGSSLLSSLIAIGFIINVARDY